MATKQLLENRRTSGKMPRSSGSAIFFKFFRFFHYIDPPAVSKLEYLLSNPSILECLTPLEPVNTIFQRAELLECTRGDH